VKLCKTIKFFLGDFLKNKRKMLLLLVSRKKCSYKIKQTNIYKNNKLKVLEQKNQFLIYLIQNKSKEIRSTELNGNTITPCRFICMFLFLKSAFKKLSTDRNCWRKIFNRIWSKEIFISNKLQRGIEKVNCKK
jgi:hypothetical protein